MSAAKRKGKGSDEVRNGRDSTSTPEESGADTPTDPAGPLYPKLSPGPTGMGHEHVAAHQRARLRGAVIQAAGGKGYAGTSVAELIKLAGISRRAFYELYESKEACFLASWERLLGESAQHIVTAYQGETDVISALRAAYQAFVTELIENPREARVVIVDVLALGPAAVERAEGIRLDFEATLVQNPELVGGFTLTPTVLTAILSGVWQVARRRLLEDRLEELRDLGDELLLWVAAYNSPAAERLSMQAPLGAQELPPLTPAGEEPDPHTRMLRTVTELAARNGYRRLTPARIIDEAHVPYETFFDRYENTGQCFIAALELGSVEVLAAALRGAQGAHDWPNSMRLGIAALLQRIARQPAYAQLAFVEVFAVGPPGVELRETLLKRTEQLLVRHAPAERAPSGVVAEAIVGAMWGLLYDRVVGGQTARLAELTEHATYIALAPVLGAEQAVASIVAGR